MKKPVPKKIVRPQVHMLEIDGKLHQQLRQHKRRTGISMIEIVRRGVALFIAQSTPRTR